ncbi:hypothetical protein CapIbe_023897 [Capra ibex]
MQHLNWGYKGRITPTLQSDCEDEMRTSFSARGDPWMSLCVCGPHGAAVVCRAVLEMFLVLPGSPQATKKDCRRRGPKMASPAHFWM